MDIDLKFTLTPKEMDELKQHAQQPQAERKSSNRSMLGWVIILALAIVIFVVFHKPDPAAGGPPPPPAPPSGFPG